MEASSVLGGAFFCRLGENYLQIVFSPFCRVEESSSFV